MKPVGLIGTGVLLLLFGTLAPTYAHQKQEAKPPKQQQQAKPENQQQAKDKQKQGQNKNKQQQPRAEQQQQQDQNKNKQQQKRAEQQDQNKNKQQRLSQQEQQQLIARQRQRSTQYGQHLDQQMRIAEQQTVQLQQQKRMAQYRFQQQYLVRLRQQRMRIVNERHDYDRDPYFYTASSYRYYRGGSYYQTNQYGADLLRQAVNYGYEEGYRAGQADQQDGWRFNYQDSYPYRDANYGYSGYYVDRDDYNYYFREGFRRGYEDGYNSRYQYGRYSNGNYSIQNTILSEILKLVSLR